MGEVLAGAAQRAGPLVVVAFEAARSDERLQPLATQLKAQRSVTAAWIVDGLIARRPLRAGVDRLEAIDVVWLLMDPVVFERLTGDRGWTTERFATWFAASALRLLAADGRQARGTPPA